MIVFPVWRSYFLQGAQAAKARIPEAAILAGIVLAAYAALHMLKKHRIFFYLPTNIPRHQPGGLR